MPPDLTLLPRPLARTFATYGDFFLVPEGEDPYKIIEQFDVLKPAMLLFPLIDDEGRVFILHLRELARGRDLRQEVIQRILARMEGLTREGLEESSQERLLHLAHGLYSYERPRPRSVPHLRLV